MDDQSTSVLRGYVTLSDQQRLELRKYFDQYDRADAIARAKFRGELPAVRPSPCPCCDRR
jgi:hypothetical protein